MLNIVLILQTFTLILRMQIFITKRNALYRTMYIQQVFKLKSIVSLIPGKLTTGERKAAN